MSKVLYLIEKLNSIQEGVVDKTGDAVGGVLTAGGNVKVGRRSGNITRHVLDIGNMGMNAGVPVSYATKGVIKGYTRAKWHPDSKNLMKDYKEKKKAIRKSDDHQHKKKADLDNLEKETIDKLSAHVKDTRDKLGKKARSDRSNERTAKRMIYGTPFGTRVF